MTDQIEGNALTTSQSASAMPTLSKGGFTFAVKKEVNLPTLKHNSGEVVLCTITDPIFYDTSTETKTVKINNVPTAVTEEKTVAVVRIRDLKTGSNFNYVLNSLTEGNLAQAYPNQAYVDKSFAIEKLEVVAGKRYKDMIILEIDPASIVAPPPAPVDETIVANKKTEKSAT